MSLLIVTVLVGALVGHVALVVSLVNVAYGQGWPRWLLRGVRGLHDLWLLLGTPWLAWLCYSAGWGHWWSLPPPLLAYLAVAVLAGCIAVPAVTIARLRRPLPQAQLSNHAHTIDVTRRLGMRPIGRGPKKLLARWPCNEQFQLEIADRTYRLSRLPAQWDGLSILHLSDLHFTGTVAFEYFEEVVARANQLNCDLVAVTGDLVDRPECRSWVPELFGRLRAREGCFAVLGNHDVWHDPDWLRQTLKEVGFRVVSGRPEVFELKGRPLLVAGTEAPWMGSLPDLSAAPPEAFRMFLSHTPDHVFWASRERIDLMLAGHNHGGQVRLPLIGPVYIPSRYGRRFDTGAFQVGPTLLHVSRGVSGKHPLRLGCKPELTRLVLRCGGQGKQRTSASLEASA